MLPGLPSSIARRGVRNLERAGMAMGHEGARRARKGRILRETSTTLLHVYIADPILNPMIRVSD